MICRCDVHRRRNVKLCTTLKDGERYDTEKDPLLLVRQQTASSPCAAIPYELEKYCPDYEIIEWNESNFDLSMNEYVRWCHAHKKRAYLSDYARLAAVYAQGGIYCEKALPLYCII